MSDDPRDYVVFKLTGSTDPTDARELTVKLILADNGATVVTVGNGDEVYLGLRLSPMEAEAFGNALLHAARQPIPLSGLSAEEIRRQIAERLLARARQQ